jgi:KUP system potassium uptake protein
MAVTGTITITTLLFFYIARRLWGRPLWLIALGAVPILGLDLLFLAANATKITHGAWLPLLIGIVAFTIMTTWQRGREIVTERRAQVEGPLGEFITGLRTRTPTVERVPGTAVFLNRTKDTAPLAMRASVDHLHALSEHALILSIDTQPVPRVPPDERLVFDDLGYTDDGIMHASARFGYMDEPDVPKVMRQVAEADLETPIDADQPSYFLSTMDLSMGDEPTMSRWRKRLFLATAHITSDAGEYFSLPRDQTVIVGSRIEI